MKISHLEEEEAKERESWFHTKMFISGPGVITGVLVSTITAIVLNRTSRFLEITGSTLPSATRNDAYSAWKWRNFLISFIHSTISGLATIFCVVNHPSLLTDMIGTSSQTAYLLASFSHGYFLYDLVEMILNLEYKGTGELVFHHLFVSSHGNSSLSLFCVIMM